MFGLIFIEGQVQRTFGITTEIKDSILKYFYVKER